MTWLAGGDAFGRISFGALGIASLIGVIAVSCGSDDASGVGPDGAQGGSGGTPRDGSGGGGGQPPGNWEVVGCETRTGDGADIRAKEAIDVDTTWSGIVYLEGSVTVDGAALTIEEGTEVVAADGAELVVAGGGTLRARGTAAAPIRFCGEQDAAGAWKGLRVAGTSAPGSELSYVLVSGAGAGDHAVLLDTATLVNNLRILDSASDGLHAAAFEEESAGLTVTAADGIAVVLTHAAAVSPFPVGGDLTGNGDDSVHLRFETVEVDATFADLDVPYVVENTILGGSGAVRIEAGVRFLFEAVSAFGVGTNAQQSLTIAGTKEAPVIFEGTVHTPGHFQGLVLSEETHPESTLSHLVIRDAGTALSTRASVLIDEVLFEENQGPVSIYPPGLAPGSSGLTVRGASGFPIAVYGVAVYQMPERIVLEDNQQDVVLLRDSSPSPLFGDLTLNESGTIHDLGVPYLVAETIDMSATVTVAAGVTLLGQWADSSLRVSDGGALVIEGTADDPVVVGPPGRTFVRPASFITVESTSSETTSLSYVDLSGGETCLELHRPVQVQHSSFADCSSHAIRGNTTAPPGYSAGDYTALMSGNSFDSASNGADETYGAF